MTITLTNVRDEAAFEAYRLARTAPLFGIRNGVRPNAVQVLRSYAWLLIALSGGRQPTEEEPELETIPDFSAYATYHAKAIAQVAPFIDLMKHCMEVLVQTPALINQWARAQGIDPPFGAEINDRVVLAEYGALLSATVTTIQNVVIAAQAMAEGGE